MPRLRGLAALKAVGEVNVVSAGEGERNVSLGFGAASRREKVVDGIEMVAVAA